MPLPMLRNGNVYIERCSFSKSHGATPTQCKVSFEAVCNVALGTEFCIDIGGSVWLGHVIDSHVHKSGSVGMVSELTCNDVRELLQSREVFCQLNQIDHKTGAIYCILDDSFVNALVALGYISAAQANGTAPGSESQYGKWEFLQAFTGVDMVGVQWDWVYPKTVIEVLCYLAGFSRPIYSGKARTILANSAASLDSGLSSTVQASNNFFGIDWHMGNKCGSALAHIADLMGLQFTLVEGERRLVFYQIGESAYGIQWQGVYAEETTQGYALQTQVDTGVWITGERDVWEMQKVDLVPAWNQAWNRWGLMGELWVNHNILRPLGLDPFATTIGDLWDAGSVTVKYVYWDGSKEAEATYTLDLSTLYDDGFTDSGLFEDLSIHDYIERVIFKVYRIGIMDQFLSADEFNGVDADGNRIPVRFKPIHTPLLSDPSVPYHVYGTRVLKKSKRHTIPVSAPKMRMEKGHRLSDETGHIAFDAMQYTVSADYIAYTTANQGCDPTPNLQAPAIPTNIMPDAPAIDVCFYGPIFRKPFGGADNPQSFMEGGITILPRIGNKKVSGLRHGKRSEAPDEDGTMPWDALGMSVQQYMAGLSDYIQNPNFELDADTEAMLVANAYLNRPHIVTSGEEHFAGFCGHEPDGEIRRVSVSIDGTRGITETVSYSNDFPSLFHEPDIELLRRMGVDEALRKGDRQKHMDTIAAYKQQNDADAKDAMKGKGHCVESQMRVITGEPLEVGLVEP